MRSVLVFPPLPFWSQFLFVSVRFSSCTSFSQSSTDPNRLVSPLTQPESAPSVDNSFTKTQEEQRVQCRESVRSSTLGEPESFHTSGCFYDDNDMHILDREDKGLERGVREAIHVQVEAASVNRGGGRSHNLSPIYHPLPRGLTPVLGGAARVNYPPLGLSCVPCFCPPNMLIHARWNKVKPAGNFSTLHDNEAQLLRLILWVFSHIACYANAGEKMAFTFI